MLQRRKIVIIEPTACFYEQTAGAGRGMIVILLEISFLECNFKNGSLFL
jgi:hypothetical protein